MEADNMTRVHDELWIDNETGEVLPATQIIKEFYATHSYKDNWTDYYTYTGEYSDTLLDAPDFARTVNA